MQLLNCIIGVFIVFFLKLTGSLTELSFMSTSRRFLVIVFTSVILGTMATFGLARLKTRVGLITDRFNIVSLTWNFTVW